MNMQRSRFLTVAVIVFVSTIVNLYVSLDWIRSYHRFHSLNARVPIKSIHYYPTNFSRPIDIDQDGEDEIAFSSFYQHPGKKSLSIFEPFLMDFHFHHYGEILIPDTYFFFDAYPDSKRKLYNYRFLALEEKKLILKDVDNRGFIVKTVELNISLPELTNDRLLFLETYLVDLEDDGKNELVISIKQDLEKTPGGIICIDPRKGILLWKYFIGPWIIDTIFTDLDGDRRKEIVLSTFASFKGISCNNTSDLFSYAIVLDHKGEPLWQQETGDSQTYTHNIAADLDDDGKMEIISTVECFKERTHGTYKMTCFNGMTGHQMGEYNYQYLSFSKPYARATNNGTFLYVGDSSGVLWMFNSNLEPVKKKTIEPKKPIYVINDHNCRWDYIFINSHDRLTVYDTTLERQIYNFDIKSPPPPNEFLRPEVLVPFRTKSGNHAIIHSDELYILNETTKPSAQVLDILAQSGLLSSSMALFLINSLLILFLYLRKRSIPSESLLNTENIEIFQGVAHQLKNPISTILWTAEKIKRGSAKGNNSSSPENYFQLADFLLEDVKALRRQTNNILKLVQIRNPNRKERNLKPILEKLLKHYSMVVDEKIRLKLEMDDDIAIYIDKNLFKEAIVNIIENAVDAMPGGGELRIAVVPVASPANTSFEKVLIEIEDTGLGIDEKDIPKLFDPFFTQKENGTGLGLAICKQIIEVHKGTIEVYSRKNFGTRFCLRIPLK